MEATMMYRQAGMHPAFNIGGATYPSQLPKASVVVDSKDRKEDVALVEKIRGLEGEVGGLRREIRELHDKMAAVVVSGENKLREPIASFRQPKDIIDEGEDDICYSGRAGRRHAFAEEFDVGLGDKLRLVHLSAKAIEVLNDVTMHCSWSTCSTNTYGFLIRNLLLRGSLYKKQLVEDTSKLLFLSFTGVLFSAGMQFILAYYLFWKMPGYYESNGEEKERSSAAGTQAPLPSYQYSTVLYETANDVCRTEQIVQIICIGLFLFYVLNNVPGIIKNFLIILRSERFISKDEEEITKLHYWRESDHSRQLEENDELRTAFFKLNIQGTASDEKFCFKCFNQLQLVEFENNDCQCNKCRVRIKKGSGAYRCERCPSGICTKCLVPTGKSTMQKEYTLPGIQIVTQSRTAAVSAPVACDNLPRSFFEVTDTRNFLGEVLEELDVDKREQVKANAGSSTLADKAKVNLVRVDYLRPNVDSFPSWTIFVPVFHSLKAWGISLPVSARLDQALQLAANVVREPAGENDRNLEFPVAENFKVSTEEFYKRSPKQFKDLPYIVELFPFNFRFTLCRLVAFVFGVLPEFITLVMITITGIQYILWSGYKIDSDSKGIEEIILATVAITFIYDIDEEFFKDAHERDQFELIGWMPLKRTEQLSLVLSWDYNRKMLTYSAQNLSHRLFGTAAPQGKIKCTSIRESETEYNKSNDKKRIRWLAAARDKWQRQHGTAKKAPQWDEGNIPMSEESAFALSVDENYNDFYLALQYPFLYARKLRFVFGVHLWQKFLVFYSTRGLHYFLLLIITLAIVGNYRSVAQCNRFAPDNSIWATQEWPTTCLMSIGTAMPVGSKVTSLYQDVDGKVVPVSCVKKGYLPDQGTELAAQEKSGYANDMSTIPLPPPPE